MQERQQFGITRRPFACFDHEQHDIHVSQSLGDDAIHHLVHGTAMPCLKPGGIDKHELFVIARQHALNAVSGRLRFARNDGDLAANQGVGQRRLANVRSPHHCDKTTTVGGCCRICHLSS